MESKVATVFLLQPLKAPLLLGRLGGQKELHVGAQAGDPALRRKTDDVAAVTSDDPLEHGEGERPSRLA